MSWIRVTRKKPCPICERPDWCSVSDDGAVAVCMRVPSPKLVQSPRLDDPVKLSGPCKSGGWFHQLDKSTVRGPVRRRKAKPVPVQEFATLAVEYVEQLKSIDVLADRLGVSIRSLERLQTGWDGRAYTFPMRNGRERIIGIRIRSIDGKKWAVKGSHNGLFWPEGVYAGSDHPLVICEGPTDCAALLDMEFDCIGRPSCSGGVDHIVEFLKRRRRDVIIMADRDEPKALPGGTTWLPGQEGAKRLAKPIRPFVRTVKIIRPPWHKDVRDWMRAGAHHDIVQTIIRNTRYVA